MRLTGRQGYWAHLSAVRRFFEDPTACFLILVAAICVAWMVAGLRYDFNLLYQLDSFDYRAISETSLSPAAALSARRAPVYPAMLTVVRVFGSSYRALPYIQYALFFASILILFRCCRLAGFKGWEALLLTAPLVNASILREYGAFMMTETPSTALAIVAMGLTFLIAAKGPGRMRNGLLAGVVVFACLMRPALLFLAPLCPLAVLLITPSVRPESNRSLLVRELVPNFASTAAPLFLYALLRFAIVGQFGIFSYGGFAIAGFGTNPALLTNADVVRLPSAEMRGLARAILQKRAQVAAQKAGSVPAFVYDEEEIRRQPILQSWTMSFDPSMWTVAVPAARTYYNASHQNSLNPHWILINDRLGALSSQILRYKYRDYMKWLAVATRSAVQNVFHYETAGRWSIGVCVVLLILIVVGRALSVSLKMIASNPRRLAQAMTTLAAALALLLAFNAEGVGSLARTSTAVIKGTIIGSLYPLTVMFYCLVATFSVTWLTLRNRRGGSHELHRTMAYATLTLLFFLVGLLLVVLVAVPWERYLIELSPLMPGALLLFSMKLIHRLRPRGGSLRPAGTFGNAESNKPGGTMYGDAR